MKKSVKILGSVLVGSVLMASSLLMSACGGKVQDSEDFLEVYCVDLGYGTAWVDAVAEKFFEQRHRSPYRKRVCEEQRPNVSRSPRYEYRRRIHGWECLGR